MRKPVGLRILGRPHRIVVNCGQPAHANADWAAATADTAAHSTLGLAHKAIGGRRGWLARRCAPPDIVGAPRPNFR